MKIELTDNHSNTILISSVWIIGALVWCYIMELYSKPLSLIVALVVLLWFPALLLKQYFFGTYLRIGVDEKFLYFPLNDKSLKEIPLIDIDYLSIEKLPYENSDSILGESYEEVIVIKLKKPVEEHIAEVEEHLWGGYYHGDKSIIYLGYTDREKTLKIISQINQALEGIK